MLDIHYVVRRTCTTSCLHYRSHVLPTCTTYFTHVSRWHASRWKRWAERNLGFEKRNEIVCPGQTNEKLKSHWPKFLVGPPGDSKFPTRNLFIKKSLALWRPQPESRRVNEHAETRGLRPLRGIPASSSVKNCSWRGLYLPKLHVITNRNLKNCQHQREPNKYAAPLKSVHKVARKSRNKSSFPLVISHAVPWQKKLKQPVRRRIGRLLKRWGDNSNGSGIVWEIHFLPAVFFLVSCSVHFLAICRILELETAIAPVFALFLNYSCDIVVWN